MSTLKKDHVLGAGGSALAAGAAGAAVGGLAAGPFGAGIGAAAGAAIGAVVGQRAAEAADDSGDLGHFEQIFETMPYYVADMRWDDYAPAYRLGLQTYRSHGGQEWAQVEPALAERWAQARDGSRLHWAQASEAVRHVWRELAEQERAKIER